MGSAKDWVVLRKMSFFSGSFWASVSSILLSLFRLFSSIFISFDREESFHSSCSIEPAAMPKGADSETSDSDDDDDSEFMDFDDTETPEPSFVFKFEYQTEALLRARETVNANVHSSTHNREYMPIPENFCSRRYTFQAENNLSFYEEAPKVESFVVKEAYADNSNCVSTVTKDEGVEQLVIEECVHEEIQIHQDLEQKEVKEDSHVDKEEQLEGLENDLGNDKVASYGGKFLPEKDSVVLEESDSDCICSSPELSFLGQFIGSSSDGFMSDTDFVGKGELGALEDIDLQNLDIGYEPDGFDEEDEDIMEQLEELEELCGDNHQNSKDSEHEGLIAKNENLKDGFDEEDEDVMEQLEEIEEGWGDNHQNPKESEPEGLIAKDENLKDGLEKSEQVSGQDFPANDVEDPNTLETLWEHQELIEQLKMELKKVRVSGLPTILEESESPSMEDLKPWKIDEKYQHGDRMGVVHKFYKSYRERMRKFDILNYQKLYAIGFLQSKDPFQSFSSSKSSTPAIKSFLLQNFGLCKAKKSSDSDPVDKFIRELHVELEVVYVGQLCLSWEFLQWQYEKALELWEYDQYGLRSYNEVAEEFQQFQVLMQRFVENERFQGPRVENYVKNRYVMRNLLQIPVIREDSLKERKKAKRKGKDIYDDDAVRSDILVEILQESIRTIWRFIRADKLAYFNAFRKRSRLELDDSLDPKILLEVQEDLQKKERKLKELLRSENCILKRFRKHDEEEEESADHLYFFSQVDIKLVSRVLNMSSITADQLVWCHNKLSKIHFVNRKIRVDPSFLLFPC